MDNCISKDDCKVCRALYDEINANQNRRLDSLEKAIEKIQTIAIAVEKMAMSIDQMTKELAKQGERLADIEAEPAQKWKQATWIVLSVVITAFATLALARLGL